MAQYQNKLIGVTNATTATFAIARMLESCDVSFQIVVTGTVSINFECSNDGTTWQLCAVIKSTLDPVTAANFVTNTTSSGHFTVRSGLAAQQYRVNQATGSGSSAVVALALPR